MNLALVMAGLAAGVAATPHCAAMCGAPCAAISAGCRRSGVGFHLGRLLGYMAGGAAAASSAGALASWSQTVPVLRPLWTLLHLGLLALGLWWLATGRQPALLQRRAAITVQWRGHGGPSRNRRSLRASIAGLAWVAWPCAALQAGLLLSALADGAAGGALVMAAFALGSLPALAAAPWAWGRWQALQRRTDLEPAGGARPSGTAASVAGAQGVALGLRLAGAGLALGSGWALTHGLWLRVAAWCGLGVG